MKLGLMLGDLAQSLFRKPATEKYPFVRYPAPTRLRSVLHLNRDKCTGCGVCVKDCPANALELLMIDKAKKRFVLRYHVDRCTFCAQCIETCSFHCLNMSNEEWELASLHKEQFTVDYGDADDIAYILGQRAQPNADPTPQP